MGPPLILCIDVEPDPRLPDRANPAPWRGFERFVEEMPALRARLRSATGQAPHFTWFLRMDPQVADTWGSATWVEDEYGEQLAALRAEGDERGLHTHSWRWDEAADSWLADRADPGWVAHCTTVAFDAFEAAFAETCRTFRGGDRHITPELLALAAARGVEVDLTIEPGLAPEAALGAGEQALGDTPDYQHAPTAPYRYASVDDYLTPGPGGDGPLMIPLFSAQEDGGGRSPLYLWTEPDEFAGRLDAELRAGVPPALAFGVRTDLPLIPEWEFFVVNLEHVAEHARLGGSGYLTASEAAAGLTV